MFRNNDRNGSFHSNVDYRAAAEPVGYSANAGQYSSTSQNLQFNLYPSQPLGYGRQYRVYPIGAHPSQYSAPFRPRQLPRTVFQYSHPQYRYPQQNGQLQPYVSSLHYAVPPPLNFFPQQPLFAPQQPTMFNPMHPQQHYFHLPPHHWFTPHSYALPPFEFNNPQQYEEQEYRARYGAQCALSTYNINQNEMTESLLETSQTTESDSSNNTELQRNGVADSSKDVSASDLQNNSSYYRNLGYSEDPYVDKNDNIHSFEYNGTMVSLSTEQNQMFEEACHPSPAMVNMAEPNDFRETSSSSKRNSSSSLTSTLNEDEMETQSDTYDTDSDDTIDESQLQPNQEGSLMLDVQKGIYNKMKNRTSSHYENCYWKIYRCNTPPNFFTDYDSMPELTGQIWQFYQSRQLTERNYISKINVINQLENMFRQHPKGYIFLLMGSTLSGLAEASSVIDIIVAIPSAMKSDLSPQDVRNEISENVMIISNVLLQRQLVHNLSVSEYSDMKIRFTMGTKNPVIVNLTLNKAFALQSTHMIFLYTQCDWRLQPIYFFVKYWAMSESFTGRPESFLSSYAITLMVIYFLQKGVEPAALPVLHELGTVKFHDNVFKQINIAKDFKWKSNNSMLLGQLVKKFFQFYLDFDFKQTVISVKTSKHVRPVVPRDCKDEYMFIEDPFTSCNVIRSCHGKIMVKRIIKSMEKMSESINKEIPLRSLLNMN